MLTPTPVSDTLKMSKERRNFYVYQNGNLEVERPNRRSFDPLGLPFLLGVNMRDKLGRFVKGQPSWSKGIKRPEYNGNKNPNWKGGITKQKQGYILIFSPLHPFGDDRKYVLEHRLVVEREIGRYLETKEKVHHLGKRNDNRPHMLMAFTSQAAHIRFERNCNVEQKEIIYDGRKLKEVKPKEREEANVKDNRINGKQH